MWLGWLVAFLVLPVLGSIPLARYGGLRLTPPRSDDWAGVLGVFLGVSIYARRNKMAPVAYAWLSISCWVESPFPSCTVSFADPHSGPSRSQLGSAKFLPSGDIINSPTGTASSRSQVFAFGVVTCLTFASLWPKLKRVSDEPPVRRWTDAFAVSFVVLFMTYLNVVKNVPEWTKKEHPLVPAVMKPRSSNGSS